MGDFRMPSLGADMEAGILMGWRVKPGDRVKRGDIIAEVETDKGLIEIEVFEDGTVERLVAQPGAKLPVGEVLATIRVDGAPAASPQAMTPEPAEAPQVFAAPPVEPASIAPAEPKHARASPLARRIAAEAGIDLTTIQGTGPGGVIERTDVERAIEEKKAQQEASSPAKKPQPGDQAPADFHARMRRAIATAMARSNREIPHFYLTSRVDMSAALRWLAEENQRRPIQQRLLPVVLLLKAVASALKEVPDLNAYWKEEQLQTHERVHIGFAIALRQGGLITPAIHDVQLKSLDELQAAVHDLIGRARAGRLRSSELMDGTVTVTSLGDLGVEVVQGVIYPPQVALVGFGRITQEPWAENGMLGVRPVVHATLAADHRATDGHKGAQFLDRLAQHLNRPESL